MRNSKQEFLLKDSFRQKYETSAMKARTEKRADSGEKNRSISEKPARSIS